MSNTTGTFFINSKGYSYWSPSGKPTDVSPGVATKEDKKQ